MADATLVFDEIGRISRGQAVEATRRERASGRYWAKPAVAHAEDAGVSEGWRRGWAAFAPGYGGTTRGHPRVKSFVSP